jgi:hypothetical protein
VEYRDPYGSHGGRPANRSALALRVVLAVVSAVTCAAGAAAFLVIVNYTVIAGAVGLLAAAGGHCGGDPPQPVQCT